jgi:hypothetical protein
MKAKILVYVAALILAAVHLADAQQTGKIVRIGFLDSSTALGSAVFMGRVPAGAAQAWMD